ncbi:hypothetical protein EB093_01275 [bacterium]|nr:hypothetical protein [bacterium]
MAQQISAQESDQTSQVLGSEYYKKLQNDIRDKRIAKTVTRQDSGERDVVEEQTRVVAVKGSTPSSGLGAKPGFGDSVTIRSFRWEQNKKGEFELASSQELSIPTAVDLTNRHVESLQSVGYKIDLSGRLGQLKQALMQSVVQSRSSNFFVGKYAEFKVGMLVRLLGSLGVTPQEMSDLKSKALEDAVAENVHLMEENIYSSELTEIVYGSGKKAKKSLRMFNEVRRQLMAQMEALGKKGYWSASRIAEEQVRQVQRIKDEFEREHSDLMYQYDYYFRMLNG